MPDLTTKYMNLNLKNPLIAASSGITKSVEKIIDCENAGAGAIVIKSLFEEVIAQENYGIEDSVLTHTEAYDYLRSQLEMQYGPRDYCELIAEAKSKAKIPIIASVNCVSPQWWPSFVKQIEQAGADAIELNVFKTATSINETSNDIEKIYFDALESVKKQIKIPVALKIGHYFTALPNFASRLAQKGVNALVLFNRFTEPDIDINKMKLSTTFSFSTAYDLHKPLRWTALLSGQINCDISATTGIKSGHDVIKMLLAGASTVQLASVLYQKGVDQISEILADIEAWMLKNNFKSINEFRGKLNFAKATTPDHYLRSQFMEKIRGVE